MAESEWGEQRRGVTDALSRALARHPVVMLIGPDHVGKSTIARRAFARPGAYIDLGKDDAARRAAIADPAGFLGGLPPSTILDDVHLLPVLVTELEAYADRVKSPGALLAVASAGGMLEVARSSSPSRLPKVRLSSLTQGELRDRISRLIPAAFAGDPAQWSFEAIDLPDYLEIALAGGLPDLVGMQDAGLRADGYTQTVNQILATVPVAESARLRRILQLVLERPNAFVSLDRDASELGMRANDLQVALETMEAIGLVRLSASWTRFRRSEGHLRVYLRDGGYLSSGLAAMEGRAPSLSPALVLRTLAANELYTQNEWARHPIEISFWRSKPSQYDVDFLLEDGSGQVVPVSISTSIAPGAGEFAGIDAFRRRHPRAYRRGLVLYPGDRIRPMSESRWAVPLSVLWTVADQEMPLEVASLDTELEAAAAAMRLLVNRQSVPDVMIGQHRAAIEGALQDSLLPRLERIGLVLGSLGLAVQPVAPIAVPPGEGAAAGPAWFDDLHRLILGEQDSPPLTVVSGLHIDTAALNPAGPVDWVAFVSATLVQQQLRWQAGHALLPARGPDGTRRSPHLVGVAGSVLTPVGTVEETMLDQLSASLASSLPDAMAALTAAA